MTKKVIAAGHICSDITPAFHGHKVRRVDEVLSPGKLINVGAATVSTGGSVANTGLAMKILGADVSLMGKVGSDSIGKMTLELLKKYDADGGMLIDDQSSSSYTVAMAIPGIDRIFLHHPGANDTFCADDLPKEKLEEAALFHFGYPTIMAHMYEDDGKGLIEILEKVKAAGCAISLDLSAIDPDSDAGHADWELILKKALPYIDFFVPSVEELCWILDRQHYAEWSERAAGQDMTEVLDIEADVLPLAQRCMELGAKVLLIKCGVPGMYYQTADRQTLEQISKRIELNTEAWAEKSGFEKSYLPEQVVSGTGCGDTSIAAFLTAMLRGDSIENCVRMAAATGACCVAAYDALSGLKSLDEMEKKIQSGWDKIN